MDAKSVLSHYADELRRIYGLNCEVDAAFGKWVDFLKTCDLEKHMIFSVGGDPNDKDTTFQYWGIMGDLAAKAARDGENSKRLRRMAVAFAYSLWEAETRASLAALCGLSTEEITHPAFGDLRKLRHAVIHVNGRLDKDLEVMTFLQKGDIVDLTNLQFHQLFKALVMSLNEIGETYFDLQPRFELDKKFQATQSPE
ncbi:hypothetical protein [Rhizobium sp. Root1220]|uniref:hypothetical protein n=1 Tax=Rhizobium sp. Root1220 TaxID=1736432 RepID=UPI0007016208|nr:hypothetical protein [Rhizobium sp. Root1220]KQV83215.1 hypothetical protein ASC90_21725 [Rhizobium sp. Root1220]